MSTDLLIWLREAHPVVRALLAGGFTLAITAAGAALVVLSRGMSEAWLDAMLGFAAGVMLAASFWSLLAPAISLAELRGMPGWLLAGVGLVDAVLGAAPGAVLELAPDEIDPRGLLPVSSHGLGVAQPVELARIFTPGSVAPCIRIVAIGIARPEQYGEGLSAAVAAAVPHAAERVLDLIGR